jgi:S-DNA-T family DNA segregation ATPase FtsK/SpoIIIE
MPSWFPCCIKSTLLDLKFVLINPKKVELTSTATSKSICRQSFQGRGGCDHYGYQESRVHAQRALYRNGQQYELLKEAGARNIKEYNEKFFQAQAESTERP